MPRKPVIVMYSPDSMGLGHIRRLGAIASRVVAQSPSASVLLMVGSGVGAFFDMPPGVDSIKLPSVQKIGRDAWKPRSLGVTAQTTGRLRAAMIRQAVEVLEPDLLLVDHAPAGIWNDLVPALELIKHSSIGTQTVLGLRDILDEPQRIRQKWQENGTYAFIRSFYDSLLIYGAPEVFSAAEHYRLSACVRGGPSYCGYVREQTATPALLDEPPPHELAALAGRKLVVVTAGGGHDAYPMMSACIASMERFAGGSDTAMVAIAGPLMAAEERSALCRQAEGKPVTVVPWTRQLSSFLSAADVIVTMGGYNSVLEAATWARPTIIIPRDGPTAEQRMRAEMFDRLGLMTHVPLADATPERLAQLIAEPPQPAARSLQLPLDGADRAASLLLDMLAERRKPATTRARAGGVLDANLNLVAPGRA